MTEYVKKADVARMLYEADAITTHGMELLNAMPAEDVVPGKGADELLEVACDLCKYPGEYKDPDDLIEERCDHCPMFEKLMEVTDGEN